MYSCINNFILYILVGTLYTYIVCYYILLTKEKHVWEVKKMYWFKYIQDGPSSVADYMQLKNGFCVQMGLCLLIHMIIRIGLSHKIENYHPKL